MNNLLYTNVFLIEATPVGLLLRSDTLGFKRIKLQDLPTNLRDRFPYEPVKAAEYEKERAIKAKALREQQRQVFPIAHDWAAQLSPHCHLLKPGNQAKDCADISIL